MSFETSGNRTSVTDELRQMFPGFVPVSEAPMIESDAQYREEWFKRYSAARVEGRNRVTYWEVQNPHLMKWQTDRGDLQCVRIRPKMMHVAAPTSKQKQLGYQATKLLAHEPVFSE